VVKVSWNAVEQSQGPVKMKKAFRGKMSVFAPELSFWGRNDAVTKCVKLYFMLCIRV